MAIPLLPAVVAVISVVGVGIFKVVDGDHDRAFFLDLSSPTPLPPPPRVTSPRFELTPHGIPDSRERSHGCLVASVTILTGRHAAKPNAPLVDHDQREDLHSFIDRMRMGDDARATRNGLRLADSEHRCELVGVLPR